MNNTMISIGRYVADNLSSFGLTSINQFVLTEKSIQPLTNGGKWLILLALRTVPDSTRKVPFGNLLLPGVKGERFLTIIEIECKTRSPNPGRDFYWNTARQFRDRVYNALAGTNRGGIRISRYDWTGFDMEGDEWLTGAYGPQRGEIWFEVDPQRSSPIEDPLEDQNDPANKSIFLTYNVHWWRPVS